MNKLLPINLLNAFFDSRIFLKKLPKGRISISRTGFGESPCAGRGRRFYSQEKDVNIVHSPMGETKIPEIVFHEYIFNNWSVWERRTAVVSGRPLETREKGHRSWSSLCAQTGKRFTFRNLRNYSKVLAAFLQNKLNLSKGDVILVILSNCVEYPVIFLAASQIGVSLTTINPLNTPFEVKKMLEPFSIKAIITNLSTYEKLMSSEEKSSFSYPTLIVKRKEDEQVPQGTIDVQEVLSGTISGPLKPVDIKPSDALVIPFSSGTTGHPKGVVLTHRNVVANLAQLTHPETIFAITPSWFRQNSSLGILPMSHSFGMVSMFFTLKEGCRLVILSEFHPRKYIETIYTKKITILYAVPQIIKLLTMDTIRPRYLKHLNFIINGSSRYSLKDANIILSKSEHIKIVQGYGLTEASPVLTHTSTRRMQKLSAVGVPIASTKLKVVSLETGETLPAGKEGELCAFGPQIMKDYFKRPEETRNAFDQHGWLKTGDLAYYDEDGDFFIKERLKYLIKVSGYQVAPVEVEDVLKLHPKVKDAVVVGVPHEKFGQVPKAFIIPVKKDDLKEEEVNQFLLEKVSKYKQLKGGVVFLEEYPRNLSGKVLREVLKKKF